MGLSTEQRRNKALKDFTTAFGLQPAVSVAEALAAIDAWWDSGSEDKPQFDALLLALRIAERERCCSLVYGHCDSDNVAQRTVDAIRRGDA